MRTLDDPAVASQFLVAFHATAGNPGLNAALRQVLTTAAEVIALVGMQLVWPLMRSTGQAGYCGHGIDQGLEHYRVMAIGAGKGQRQRDAASVDDDVPFAAQFSPVGGIGAGLLAPRGLATLAPSILARFQSIWSH